MDARFRFLACGLAVVTAVSAPAARRGLMAEFTSGSLVLVPIHVNGHGPYPFLLDTGATTTTLDHRIANELALQPTGTIEIVTSGGTFSAPTGLLDEMRIGSVRISATRVSWMPLDALHRDNRRIAGVIGQDVLASRVLMLDYDRGEVELTSNACRRTDRASVAITWADGRPTIAVGLHGPGLPPTARLVLDSAANALVLFLTDYGGMQTTTVATHQATAPAHVVPRVAIDVGGARRMVPAVVLPPSAPREETGLLPTAWFSRVCIDGPRSLATMSPVTRVGPSM